MAKNYLHIAVYHNRVEIIRADSTAEALAKATKKLKARRSLDVKINLVTDEDGEPTSRMPKDLKVKRTK